MEPQSDTEDCCDEEEEGLLALLHLSDPAKEDLDHLDSYFEGAQVTFVPPAPTSSVFIASDIDISLGGIGPLSDSSDDEMMLSDVDASVSFEKK